MAVRDDEGRRESSYTLFVRNYVATTLVGVHPHEFESPQRVRIGVALQVAAPPPGFADDLNAVVSYERIIESIRVLLTNGHIMLLETLASRLADACLADPRSLWVQVRVEKLDVFPETEEVGIELVRRQR